MRAVLDNSVTMGWFIKGQGDNYTDRVLDLLGECEFLVPAIWSAEFANGMAVTTRRKIITQEDAKNFSRQVTEVGLLIDATPPSHERLLELAEQLNLTAYDACYAELAMRHGLPLATRDKALRTAAVRAGVGLVE